MKIEFKISNGYWHQFDGKKIDEVQSSFQNIKVYDLEILGRTLVLDDYIMVAEFDEHIYHELMVHPACQTLKKYDRALIVGGGDLLCAQRVLKYPFKMVDQFEIDVEVTNMMLKHFKYKGFDVFSHARFNPQYRDALKIMDENHQYDFIALDLNDPAENDMTSHPLFTASFYKNCYEKLSNHGIMTVQVGCPETFHHHFMNQINSLHELFEHHLIYGRYMRCYGTYQYFYMGMKEKKDMEIIKKNIHALKLNTQYHEE